MFKIETKKNLGFGNGNNCCVYPILRILHPSVFIHHWYGQTLPITIALPTSPHVLLHLCTNTSLSHHHRNSCCSKHFHCDHNCCWRPQVLFSGLLLILVAYGGGLFVRQRWWCLSCETHNRYGSGSETPMHSSRTPLHPYMTPMRDPGARPIHDGMRTPMRDRAWNPYTPMSPTRESWEDGNPGSWGSSSQYQPGSPRVRAYEAPTPGSGWANTPGGSYSEAGIPRDTTPAYANAPSPYLPSTPGGQPPMTPSSAFLPGGQPMTPGGGGLDIMSPVVGRDNDGPWFLPDILVNLHRSGEDAAVSVIREVLLDGACRVALGTSGNGDVITANPTLGFPNMNMDCLSRLAEFAGYSPSLALAFSISTDHQKPYI